VNVNMCDVSLQCAVISDLIINQNAESSRCLVVIGHRTKLTFYLVHKLPAVTSYCREIIPVAALTHDW